MESDLIFQNRVSLLRGFISEGVKEFEPYWKPYLEQLLKEGKIQIVFEDNKITRIKTNQTKVGEVTEQELFLYRSSSGTTEALHVCLSQFEPKNVNNNFGQVVGLTSVMANQIGWKHVPFQLPEIERGKSYRVKLTLEVIEELPDYYKEKKQ